MGELVFSCPSQPFSPPVTARNKDAAKRSPRRGPLTRSTRTLSPCRQRLSPPERETQPVKLARMDHPESAPT